VSWFPLPDFDSPIDEQRASVLHSLALFVIAVAVPLGTFHVATGQAPMVGLAAYGTLIALQVGVLVLVRRRRVSAAAILYVSVYWSVLALLTFFLGGIGQMHASGLIVVTLMAGLSLGTRGALVVGGASMAFVLLLAALEARGLMPPAAAGYVAGTMEHASTLLSNVLLATAFVYLSMRSLTRSMGRERHERTINERRALQGTALGRLGQFAVGAPARALAEEAVKVLQETLDASAVLVLEQTDGGPLRLAASGVAEGSDDPRLHALKIDRARILADAERPAFVDKNLKVVAAPMPGAEQPVGLVLVVLPASATDLEPSTAFVNTVAAMLGAALAREAAVAQLHQAQKMEIVGRLAGGIAHDFNNLLTIIVGCGEMLVLELEGAPEQQALARDVEGAASRAALMTRQLLTFSRRQVEQPQALDLNVVIAEFQPMLQRLLRADVVVDVRASAVPTMLLADRASLEQVVLNLAVNARDAMVEGGRLTLTTRLDGGEVELSVQDNGHGMDELTQRRIFEPFFTTRAEGTGLGLATVKAAVERSGGRIAVSSSRDAGTTFVLRFPAVTATVGKQLVRGPMGGSELLLLVDDDAQVRRTMRRLLERGGYQIVDAASGEEGLEQLQTTARNVAMVITDVVMAGMGGMEFGRRCQQRNLRVLYVSGFADAFDASQGPFLAKPFEGPELLAAVRELLDAATEPAERPTRAAV